MATYIPWDETTRRQFQLKMEQDKFEIEVRALTLRSAKSAERLRLRLDRLGPWARKEWKERTMMGWSHPDMRLRAAVRKASAAF